jgi:hypothetical protein
MELDLQSLFGIHVHNCTLWQRPRRPAPPPPPDPPPIWAHIRGRYWLAKIDDISLGPLWVKPYHRLAFFFRKEANRSSFCMTSPTER